MKPFHRSFLLVGVGLSMALSGHAQLTRQANSTLALPADLPSASGFALENALGTLSFSEPLCVTSVPGESNRLFVAERGGTIQVVNLTVNPPTKAQYLSIAPLLTGGDTLTQEGECGLLSIAFHPNFAANGRILVYYSIRNSADGTDRLFERVARITVSNPASNTATVTNHQPLLTMYDEASNHNGGDMAFGPDGYLYISLGDEGNGNDSFNNARFITKDFWGSFLRLDVDNLAANLAPNAHTQLAAHPLYASAIHAGAYKVPADNPFIGFTSWHNQNISATAVRTEKYATGLRNPYRFSFDPPTGRLFCGDVGQDTYEEVDIIVKGGDYGWSWREGTHAFTSGPSPSSPPAMGFNPVSPIFDYDHTNNGETVYGNVIAGGQVYRGNTLTELYGAYVFADAGSGYIVALRENGGVWTPERLAVDANITEFGTDPRNGELLLCDRSSNTIKRLIRSGTTGTNPPATLSATGAFSSLASLTPNTGIVAYDPNVTFWSDYAIKSRWFSIKNLTDKIGFAADANWTFPTGTIWIKHFDIELERGNAATRRRLETRFLVKTATDVYGLSYRWNNIASGTQTEANLVAESGLTEVIPGSNPAQTWRYPSRTECKTCHTQVAGFALSFNTRQMNRSHLYGAATQNQISALSGAGYFTTTVSGAKHLPALAAAGDTASSLEWRVRSYLAANCVQCHQPGGAALGNWDARATTATDLANLINGGLQNPAGDAANRFVVPGDTAHSMLLKRIRGDGVQRMPPLATNERDLGAEQLITDWINQALPSRQSYAQWQVSNFGSTGNPNAALSADPDLDGEKNEMEFLRGTMPNLPTPPLASLLTTSSAGGVFTLNFQQPANRSVLVETTTDFQTWSLWDVPGNAPTYPAVGTNRTLMGPVDVPNRIFRIRISDF